MRIFYEKSQDQRVQLFNNFIKSNFPEFLVETDPEVVLVAGGDGAMLHSTAKNLKQNVIFFGKGLGTLNFLMNNFDNDKEIINSLKNNSIKIDLCESFSLAVYKNNNYIGHVVNEIVLGDSITSYISFALHTASGELDGLSFKGGGLCISTPIGSTAFNFNNNGNILPLQSDLISVTGIVTNKYLNDIISSQEITITSSNAKIFLDGMEKTSVSEHDTILIKPDIHIKLGFLNKNQFISKRIEFSNRLRKG